MIKTFLLGHHPYDTLEDPSYRLPDNCSARLEVLFQSSGLGSASTVEALVLTIKEKILRDYHTVGGLELAWSKFEDSVLQLYPLPEVRFRLGNPTQGRFSKQLKTLDAKRKLITEHLSHERRPHHCEVS